MDFAPYQSQDPSKIRALSPPPPQLPNNDRRSRSFSPRTRTQQGASFPAAGSPYLSTAAAGATTDPWGRDDDGSGDSTPGSTLLSQQRTTATTTATTASAGAAAAPGPRAHIADFETGLGLRLDIEAALAYVLLPPAGGVALLLLETRSDYVRFHAWQSSLLFAVIFILHLIFAWSAFLSWALFIFDVGAIALLASRAYRDAETLERYEVPFFGKLANNILDD
ncbi:MAG: hypothetical protein M1825_002278, partial [Sarcosagium campestre]